MTWGVANLAGSFFHFISWCQHCPSQRRDWTNCPRDESGRVQFHSEPQGSRHVFRHPQQAALGTVCKYVGSHSEGTPNTLVQYSDSNGITSPTFSQNAPHHFEILVQTAKPHGNIYQVFINQHYDMWPWWDSTVSSLLFHSRKMMMWKSF